MIEGKNKNKVKGGFESKILELLRRLGKASLDEICRAFRQETGLSQEPIEKLRDRVRKALERLEAKRLVKKIGRGLYEYSRHPTLDDFFEGGEGSGEAIIELDKIHVSVDIGSKLLKIAEERGAKLRDVGYLKGGFYVSAVAADESSHSLEPYATLHSGAIIRISTRIRVGCIAPFGFELYGDSLKTIPPEALGRQLKFIPEHISRGGTVEFSVEKLDLPKLKRPYLESPIFIRRLSFRVASEVAKKLSDYDMVEFKLDMIEQAVAEAKYEASSSDITLAFVDGWILPGHLDPFIYPGSGIFDEWPEEVTKLILGRKERILRKFLGIYQSTYGSENVVLVGAHKNSNDRTLQSLAGIYHSYPDQQLLARLGIEGKVLGPLKKHRVEGSEDEEGGLVRELKKFGIQVKRGDIDIESYYIMKRKDSLPLQIDVIFPKYMEERERSFIIDTIYYLTEVSEKHTWLRGMSGKESFKVLTLRPISIVDEKVGKKAEELAEVMERDLSMKLYDLFEELERYGRGLADVALFVYFPHLASLRRVM
jgi:hypothetical protein